MRGRLKERMNDPPAAIAQLSPEDQRALRDILRRALGVARDPGLLLAAGRSGLGQHAEDEHLHHASEQVLRDALGDRAAAGAPCRWRPRRSSRRSARSGPAARCRAARDCCSIALPCGRSACGSARRAPRGSSRRGRRARRTRRRAAPTRGRPRRARGTRVAARARGLLRVGGLGQERRRSTAILSAKRSSSIARNSSSLLAKFA